MYFRNFSFRQLSIVCIFSLIPFQHVYCACHTCGPGNNNPPPGFTLQGIGIPTSNGGCCYDSGSDTLQITGDGTGVDEFTTSDQFIFCHKQLSGDFVIVAKIECHDASLSASTGLMVRRSLDADSAFVASGPWGNKKRSRVQFRSLAGNRIYVKVEPSYYENLVPTAHWLKMVRYKNRISSYYSLNNTDVLEDVEWKETFSHSIIDLPENDIYAGIYSTKGQYNPTNSNASLKYFSITPLDLDYQTTWLGNTWPAGQCIPHWIEDIFVDPDAKRIYTNTRWDEDHKEICIFDETGQIINYALNTHQYNGVSITVGDNYIFGEKMIKSSQTQIEYGWYLGRWEMNGDSAGVVNDISSNGHLHGMAVDASSHELYVARTFDNDNYVYGTDLSYKRSFPADNPRNMIWHNGGLWVSTGPVTDQPAKVVQYDSNGTILTTIEHVDLRNPDDLAVHPGTGHLWVCDNDPDIHQVLIFDMSTGNRVTDPYLGQDYLGDRGGIYSGTPGEVMPKKFNFLSGIGFIKSDDWTAQNQYYDIIVATNGPPVSHVAEGTGCVLRKFDPFGQQPDASYWTRYGLEFIDTSDADPGTDGLDVFTKHGHYVMNWNHTEGQDQLWTYRGFTLDKYNYPDDHRNWEGVNSPEPGYRSYGQSGVFVRRIEGQRFLFLTDQQSDSLSYYRFTPGSEIAIPCGRMDRNINDPDYNNIMNQWLIWRDVNGDGRQSKTTEWDTSRVHGDNTEDWYVDFNGDIWVPDKWYGIKHFICDGLDSNGVPRYSWASYEHFEPPDEFKVPFVENPSYQLCRLVYLPDSDNLDGTMFLMGYTDLYPRTHALDTMFGDNHNSGVGGRELICYENWYGINGPRAVRWRVNGADENSDLPYMPLEETDLNNGGNPFLTKCLTATSNKVFVTMSSTPDTRMFDNQTGQLEAILVPGPEIGAQTGWYDIPHSTNAFQRQNGETLVFLEEDMRNKITIYRLNEGLDINAPAAPTGLAGVAITDEIQLDWDDNTELDLAGYNVYRSTNPGGPYPSGPFGEQLNLDTLTASQFVDINVGDQVNYYYIVRAIDNNGNESYNSVELNIQSDTTTQPPLPPTDLSTVSMDGMVDLSWTCSISTNPAVLYYKVYRSLESGGPYSNVAIAFGGCGITDSQVYNELVYYYVTTAVNVKGRESQHSAEASGSPSVQIPIAPSSLAVSSSLYDEVDLAWLDNSDDETTFEIERSDEGSPFTLIDTVGTNDTTYTDQNLSGDTSYCYRVRATNTAGNSGYTNEPCTTTPVEIPYGPDTIIAGAMSSTEIFMIWDDTDITHTVNYQIERTNDLQIFDVAAPQTNYIDTSLSPGTTYTYRIRACNTNGCSDWKDSDSATTTMVLPPVTPGNLLATPFSHTGIDLTWTNNSTTVTSFEIQRKSGAGNYNYLASVPGDVASYSDAGLENDTSYTYRVRAVNSAGYSDFSFPTTGTTLSPPVDTEPPDPPSSLSVSDTGADLVTITWSDNSNNELGFKIERYTGEEPFHQIDTTGPNATSYTDRGLSPSTSYTYRVRAYNSVDNSASYTNEIAAMTLTGETHTELLRLDFEDSNPRFVKVPCPPTDACAGLEPEVVDLGSNKVLKLGDRGTNEFLSTEFDYEIFAPHPFITEINNVISNIGGPSVDFLFALDIQRATLGNRLAGTGHGKIRIFTTPYDDNPPPGGQGTDLLWTSEPSVGINPHGVEGFAEGEWIHVNESVFPKGGEFYPLNAYPHRGLRFTVTPKSIGSPTLITAFKFKFDAAAETGVNEESYYIDNITLHRAASVRPSPPTPPTNLNVQASGPDSIDLNWTDNSNDEDIFKILRSTDGIDFQQVATVPADTITYIDTNLQPQMQYSYRIKANNQYGDSHYTSKKSATTPAEKELLFWKVDFQDRSNPFKLSFDDSHGSMKLIRHFNAVGNFALELKDESIGGHGSASEFYILLDYFNPVTLRVNEILKGSSPVDMQLEFDIQQSSASNNPHENNGFVCLEAWPWDGNPPSNGTGRDFHWTGEPIFAGLNDPVNGYLDGQMIHMDHTVYPLGYDATAPNRGFRFTIKPDGSGRTINEMKFRIQVGAAAAALPEAMTIDNLMIYELTSDQNGVTPAPATNLVATSIDDTTILLTWTDNSDNESRFKIWRQTGIGDYQLITIVDENNTSYLDTTVRPETRYSYYVKSNNMDGDSTDSTNVDAATTRAYPSPQPPDGPSGLMTGGADMDAIEISWIDNANNEDNFVIERADGTIISHGEFTVIDTIGANDEVLEPEVLYIDSGLVSGNDYTYRVYATNSEGDTYSNEAEGTPALPPPPATPLSPDARGFTETQTVMFWVDYADNEDCFRLERTLIDPFNPEIKNFVEIAVLPADTVGYVDTEVVSDQLYTYRMRACNNVGVGTCEHCSDYTMENTAYVLSNQPSGVPPTVYDLSAYATESDTIEVSWDADMETDYYSVERSPDGNNWSALADFTWTRMAIENTARFYDTNLLSQTLYYYRIRGHNSRGEAGLWSNSANATTPAPPPSSAPDSLCDTYVGINNIDIEWKDHSDDETGFKIERKDQDGQFTQIDSVGPNVTTYSDTGLNQGITYAYRVRSYNSYGDSSYSNVDQATTFANTDPPEAPTDLNAVASAGRIDLAWVDHADNEQNFVIERKEGSGSFVVLVDDLPFNTTIYDDTGLPPLTTYTYRVKAVNAYGSSAWSNEDSDTTPTGSPPNPPTDLAVSQVLGLNALDLTWTDQSGNEDDFEIERTTDGATFIVTYDAESYRDPNLTWGATYTYRIRSRNTYGPSSWDGPASGTVAAASVVTEDVDDADAEITYTGSWSANSGWSGRYLETIHESNDGTTPASAEYTFIGFAIRLYGDKQQWGGTIDVYIDEGLILSDVSFYDAVGQLNQQLIFTVEGLSYSEHTLKIEKSGGDWIYVDKIEYDHY